MKNLFNRFVREEQGQDLIEYTLLAGLISLAQHRRDHGARHRDSRPLHHGRRQRRGGFLVGVPGGACLPGNFVRPCRCSTGEPAPCAGSQLPTERFRVTRTLARILREDDGQDLIEYALVAALISVISVLAIESVGEAVNKRYETSTTTFAGS